MRTIKFRGKDSNGNWHYGDLEHSPIGKFCRIHEYWDNGLYKSQYDVKPATVGQYTGLTDKNGMEIYEGDIVSHPWKDPIFGDLVETGQFVHSTICFNNGAFVVNYRLQGEYIYLQDFVRLKCLEVVGNIHDNPELLGEK